MNTLRLVNPQPMETLPLGGRVFVMVGSECDWMNVEWVHMRMAEGGKYDAWSYTATYGESTEMIPKPVVKVVWDESTQLYDVTVNGVIADDGLYRVDAVSSAHYHAEILGLSPDDVIVEDAATFEPKTGTERQQTTREEQL